MLNEFLEKVFPGVAIHNLINKMIFEDHRGRINLIGTYVGTTEKILCVKGEDGIVKISKIPDFSGDDADQKLFESFYNA